MFLKIFTKWSKKMTLSSFIFKYTLSHSSMQVAIAYFLMP